MFGPDLLSDGVDFGAGGEIDLVEVGIGGWLMLVK